MVDMLKGAADSDEINNGSNAMVFRADFAMFSRIA